MISVYRAIYGRRRNECKDEDVFNGASLYKLHKYGLTVGNGSVMQNSRMESLEPAMRRVPGLPVFLNEREAIRLLKDRRVRSGDPDSLTGWAVLGHVAINEQLLADGTVSIYKNVLDLSVRDDRLLTLDELEAHRDGRISIVGECYIPSFPTEQLLGATTLKVARIHTLNGEIDFTQDEPLVDIDMLVPDWHDQAEAYATRLLYEFDHMFDHLLGEDS